MKKFSILLVAAVFMLGCKKDFLERYPITAPSEVNFWNSDADLEIYCNQFYTVFQAHPSHATPGIFIIDNNSDNMVPAVFDERLAGTRIIPTSGGDWNWKNIRAVNYYLENQSKVKVTDGNKQNVNHYLGEIKFFRAFLYFNLLKNFGDLPWVGHTLAPDLQSLQISQIKRNIIADSIVNDLDHAISLLKPKGTAKNFRINREIALAFKSRVCLFEGTWEKYHQNTPFGVEGSNGEKFLKEAIAASERLITEGKFNIYTMGDPSNNYRNLFNQIDLSSNPEVMLWKKYDVGLNITNQVQKALALGGATTGLSQSLVNDYLMDDGKPTANHINYMGDHSLKNIVQDRDPRLAQTMAVQGYPLQIEKGQVILEFIRPSFEVASEFRSTTGYHLYKGLDPNQVIYTPNMALSTAAIIFRYAEVLLNFAEAKAELGQLTQGNLDISVNKLRDRVNMKPLVISGITNDPNWIYPTLSPILNEIRRERRVELACEGFRLDDILRWRAHALIENKRPKGLLYKGGELEGTYINPTTGKDLLVVGENIFLDANGYVDPYQKVSVLQNGFKFDADRDYLSPIPLEELKLNKKLNQNPGW